LSVCGAMALVKDSEADVFVKPLRCRSWLCSFCCQRRRKQLMAEIANGQPDKFITVTSNPAMGGTPESRRLALGVAWATLVKRIKRTWPHFDFQYMAVVEETKAGEPHLHVAARAPFIPQWWLSNAMKEIADSPIVDIRKIRGVRQAVRYLAKYITKQPAQFGTTKRYWKSRGYALPNDDFPKLPKGTKSGWLPNWNDFIVTLRLSEMRFGAGELIGEELFHFLKLWRPSG